MQPPYHISYESDPVAEIKGLPLDTISGKACRKITSLQHSYSHQHSYQAMTWKVWQILSPRLFCHSMRDGTSSGFRIVDPHLCLSGVRRINEHY